MKLIDKEKVKSLFIRYYIKFLQNTIVRKDPAEKYWNSLVSDKMTFIESHWPSVCQAISWAKEMPCEKEAFVELVMMLVHYMDSRFYNNERIELVSHAIQICEELDWNAYAAVLSIDALGWTYIEEGDLKKAEMCILEGQKLLRLLGNDEATDLSALALAWLARTRVESDPPDLKNAEVSVRQALEYNGKPWIKSRIFEAAGDIFYKKEEYGWALEYYKAAKSESAKYGGEGNDYRMNPRIGLAYLSLAKESNLNLKDAEQVFTEVRNNPDIYINKLYGEYGLALVNFEKNKVEEAHSRLIQIEEEILKRSKSNVLLKLIGEYKRKNHV